MRGHIGYKIPRQPTPTIRLSFATFDALTFEAGSADARLSFLGFDALTYETATTEQYLSFLGFDAVTYSPADTTAHVSFLSFDTLTYNNTAPDAPTGIFGIGTDTGVVLTWRAAGAWGQAATNHTVQYKSSTDTDWTTVSTSSALTTFTVTGLTPGEVYTFRVSATNLIGTGPYSLPANASPMPSANPFSASMYLLSDWYWETNGGDTVLGLEDSTFPLLSVQATQHTSAYFPFFPQDYTATGATYFQFVTGINDALGTNRQTACASTDYGETGANVANCEYSYQFQRRLPDAIDAESDWTNVYTYEVLPGTTTGVLPRPRYPQELAVTQANGLAGLHYEAGVRYEHRCIVTRKSDGAKYITYTCTVITNQNINS